MVMVTDKKSENNAYAYEKQPIGFIKEASQSTYNAGRGTLVNALLAMVIENAFWLYNVLERGGNENVSHSLGWIWQ